MLKIILTILAFSLIHMSFAYFWMVVVDGFFARRRHSDQAMGAYVGLAVAHAFLCVAAGFLFAVKSTFFGIQLDHPTLLFAVSVVPALLLFGLGPLIHILIITYFEIRESKKIGSK